MNQGRNDKFERQKLEWEDCTKPGLHQNPAVVNCEQLLQVKNDDTVSLHLQPNTDMYHPAK